MVRLSSRLNPFVRRFALPVWVCLAFGSAAYAAVQGGLTKDSSALFITAVFVVVFGYLLQRQSRQLVDSVVDCGGFLEVRRDEVVVRVPLQSIAEIATGYVPRSTTIVLRLSVETALGTSVRFIPRYMFLKLPVGAHPIAKELLARAAVARGSGVA